MPFVMFNGKISEKMKKKTIIFSISVVVLSLLIILGFVVGIMISWDLEDKKWQKSADYYAGIDTFLNAKNNDYNLVVSNYPKSPSNYYADINNDLYNNMKDIYYIEQNDKLENSYCLYKIEIGIRKDKNNTNDSDSNDYILPSNVSVYVLICTENIIKTYSNVNASLNSASSKKIYKLDDNDYNLLIEKINLIIENGEVYNWN